MLDLREATGMSSFRYVDEEDVATVRAAMDRLHTFTPAQYINDHTLDRPLDHRFVRTIRAERRRVKWTRLLELAAGE